MKKIYRIPLNIAPRAPGYKVSMSLEGNKAISLATGKNNPDLVILDLMLPDISGLDVCKEIRATL